MKAAFRLLTDSDLPKKRLPRRKVRDPKVLEEDLKRIRRRGRVRLARELKHSRQKLGQLKEDVAKYEKAAAGFQGCIQKFGAMRSRFPEVPPVTGLRPPDRPGVYFIWRDGVVVYVGQATKLRRRLLVSVHHILTKADRFSFVEMSEHLINYAEAFYIGTLFPACNFGRKQKVKLKWPKK